jgi:predicted nucleic acid-binding Zn ribbon protein
MEPLQQTVPAFLAELLRRAPLSPEKLAFAWRTSVGPAMARVSTAHITPDGVVEVRCADDHWRRELKRAAPVITERLRALLGPDIVKKLKVPGPSRRVGSRHAQDR